MTSITLAGTSRRSPQPARAARLIKRAMEPVLVWRARARDRGELARLSDRMLCDIGMTRLDAEREFRKPFWRG